MEKPAKEPAKTKPGRTVEVETYMYHATETPRVFTPGEEVPDGWSVHPGSWRQDAVGKWINDKSKG